MEVKLKIINEKYINGLYDSFLVIAHFKGHGWGGFGGALKQLIPYIIYI